MSENTALGKRSRADVGVYVPPHRLQKLAEQVADKSSKEYQRMSWDALRKSINGLVNKVNITNIMNIIPELFNENIVRGRGLLCRSVMKAQAASPTFTQVYAALIAVINAKMPQVGELLLTRSIIQFRRAFQRNDKLQLLAATRFLAHLLNQQVAGEILALQILALLLETPTDDSVEVASEFIIQCGYVLQSLSPEGFNGVFERFRAILHEGEISQRVQYIIEHVFAVRKSQFSEYPGVIEALDLIDAEDQITHEDLTLDADPLDPLDHLNYFHFDPDYLEHEEKFQAIKKVILADFSEGSSDSDEEGSSNDEADNQPQQQQQIHDMTESKLLDLRRSIYLTIMSSLDFEECAHKLLKLKITEGMENELCNMIIECCTQERTFQRFYGLLAQRFCSIDRVYQELFEAAFVEQYEKIYRLETGALRNVAKFFSHLLYTDAINWGVLQHIRLNEQDTNSSSRIFIKILFQELAEFISLEKLNRRLHDPTMAEYFSGILPKNSNTRFAINFFTSIGLGGLTDELREFLKTMPQKMLEQAALESSSDSSSDSSDSSDSSSDSSSSSSETSSSSESDHSPVRKRPHIEARKRSPPSRGSPATRKAPPSKNRSSPVSDRSSYRNRSPIRNRSPSARNRSPIRDRSPPVRTRSPIRDRSPVGTRSLRDRSPPVRTRSPARDRSPIGTRSSRDRSPVRTRSPIRARSPFSRNRSPIRDRSPPTRNRSPIKDRSPPVRNRSPIRDRSPVRREYNSRRGARSPARDRSPPERSRRSSPPRRDRDRSPVSGYRGRPRDLSRSPRRSPIRDRSPPRRDRR